VVFRQLLTTIFYSFLRQGGRYLNKVHLKRPLYSINKVPHQVRKKFWIPNHKLECLSPSNIFIFVYRLTRLRTPKSTLRRFKEILCEVEVSQCNWAPCTNQGYLTAFEPGICFSVPCCIYTKVHWYLQEEVNCTKPSL